MIRTPKQMLRQTAYMVNWVICSIPLEYVICNNGSKFKLHSAMTCNQYSIKYKPTMTKNPQLNAISDCLHSELSNMLHTSGLESKCNLNPTHHRCCLG